MTDGNFEAVPVVGKGIMLVGLVSAFDSLQIMEEEKDLHEITVEEIMTSYVVTVTEEILVRGPIYLLQKRHLIGAPVLQGRTLVGIVKQGDVLSVTSRRRSQIGGRKREDRNYIVAEGSPPFCDFLLCFVFVSFSRICSSNFLTRSSQEQSRKILWS